MLGTAGIGQQHAAAGGYLPWSQARTPRDNSSEAGEGTQEGPKKSTRAHQHCRRKQWAGSQQAHVRDDQSGLSQCAQYPADHSADGAIGQHRVARRAAFETSRQAQRRVLTSIQYLQLLT